MSYKPPIHKQLFHNLRRLIAKNWLSHQKVLQIAITGSYGKTITTQTIAKVLSTIGQTTVTDTNLDTIYNVPITALKVFRWTRFAVFELGVDKPGEMDFHLQLVKAKIAVITGISPVHTDAQHLKSLTSLIQEKRKLIEALPKNGYAILNYDDSNVRKMAPYTKAKILWYGTDKKHCDIWADDVQVSLAGIRFKLFSTNLNKFQLISTKLIGRHHIYTIMATYGVLKAVENLLHIPTTINQLTEVVKTISPLPGRMSLETGPLGTTVLNDSLRANPASTESGLKTLSDTEYKKGRKIAVLAEMGELEQPENEHKKIGRFIADIAGISFIIFLGPLQKFAYKEAVKLGYKKESAFWVNDVFAAASILKHIIKKGDLIYLKGSLLRHVERVLLLLEGKKVGCTVVSCPFYHHCLKCPYLEIGYQNISAKPI